MELTKEHKTMNFNENSQSVNENFDVDFKLSLPQYLDDVEKVVKCDAKTAVCNYEYSNGSVKLYCKCIISVIYCNSTNCLLSNIFEEEFTKSFDVECSSDFCFAKAVITTKYCNYRLINQRRIDINLALNGYIYAFCKTNRSYLTDCEGALVRQENPQFLNVKESAVSWVDFDEMITVSNKNQIQNIVNTYFNIYVDDIKIIKEKMLIKMMCEASIVYLDENNSIQKSVSNFQVNKIIESSVLCEDDTVFVNTSLSNIYVKTKANDNNLLNEVEIVGKISLNYTSMAVMCEEIITDAYVPHYNCQLESEKINLKLNPVSFDDTSQANIVFDCDKSIAQIIDLKAECVSAYINNSVLHMLFNVSYLFYDDDANVCCYDDTKEISMVLGESELNGTACIFVKSYDYVIKNSNSIEVKINYRFIAYTFEDKSFEVIVDIIQTDEKINCDNPELTLYFANSNEDIWDIAKKFSTSSQLIIDENNLTTDKIDGKRILLVPGM